MSFNSHRRETAAARQGGPTFELSGPRGALLGLAGLLAILVWAPWGCGSSSDPDLPQDPNLVKACIRATACDVKPYPTISNCLSYYEDFHRGSSLSAVSFQIYTCTNRAGSCAAVRECFGAGSPCDKSYEGRCEGGQALFCDLIDHVSYRYDCGAVGLSCTVDPAHPHDATCQGSSSSGGALSTAVDCEEGHCSESDQPCTTNDEYNRCEGAALQACLDSRWVTFDCAMLGLGPCRRESGGWARCSDPADP